LEVRVLIDTNRYRDFCSGIPEIVGLLKTAESIYLSFITLGELRAGFLFGIAGRQNERILGLFLNSPRVRTLWADENTTHHYARLLLQLRRQGSPIPTNDMWIAALALQHDLALCSRDSHFDSLPQLPRV
jgi:tRNA(fMet)-specific endonuclease VapC